MKLPCRFADVKTHVAGKKVRERLVVRAEMQTRNAHQVVNVGQIKPRAKIRLLKSSRQSVIQVRMLAIEERLKRHRMK